MAMAADMLHLLDDLEAQLARSQAELKTLREENQRLERALDEVRKTAGAVKSEQVNKPTVAPMTAVTLPIEEESWSQAEAGDATDAGSVDSLTPHALLESWYERYPNAFFKGHTKPLKVGIHQDLIQREQCSSKLIRRALANYINLPRYAKAVRSGAERVDLDGNLAGVVDAEAARHAAEKRKTLKNSQAQRAGKGVHEGGAAPSESKPEKKRDSKRTCQAENSSSTARKATPAKKGAPLKEQAAKPSAPLSFEEKLKGLQAKYKAH
ncbi:ProQ/FINO family protein [Halomonas dongshanensis]|uniref:ProQ/FINO family protein n=1 Tax=Halomonas dongshanensis TaxID=2890835 RepID=A0ABT2EC30_9GAMM|nr:ProQ/FINO family protein [Halomonas dongshanensis]MCS2609126.1 ProQ/FINO family protein [Halomonas dongshanensis]